jgi:hypothetical protein
MTEDILESTDDKIKNRIGDIDSTTDDLRKLAQGTTLRVEVETGTLYALGSELEVLRLFAIYNGNGVFASTQYRVAYSKKHKAHMFYFSLMND